MWEREAATVREKRQLIRAHEHERARRGSCLTRNSRDDNRALLVAKSFSSSLPILALLKSRSRRSASRLRPPLNSTGCT